MIEHEDGSVTLTAKQFKVLAMFLEARRVDLRALLTERGDDLTDEDLARLGEQLALLITGGSAMPS